MNSLLFPRIHYEFIFGFANPLWIHFLLREYSMNSFSVACIHYPSREYIMNSQSISQFTIDRVSFLWIHYEITLNSLSITLIHYKFTFYLASSLLIHYFFENSLSVLHFLNSLSFFENLPRIHCLLRLFKMYSLSFSRKYYESIILFTEIL